MRGLVDVPTSKTGTDVIAPLHRFRLEVWNQGVMVQSGSEKSRYPTPIAWALLTLGHIWFARHEIDPQLPISCLRQAQKGKSKPKHSLGNSTMNYQSFKWRNAYPLLCSVDRPVLPSLASQCLNPSPNSSDEGLRAHKTSRESICTTSCRSSLSGKKIVVQHSFCPGYTTNIVEPFELPPSMVSHRRCVWAGLPKSGFCVDQSLHVSLVSVLGSSCRPWLGLTKTANLCAVHKTPSCHLREVTTVSTEDYLHVPHETLGSFYGTSQVGP